MDPQERERANDQRQRQQAEIRIPGIESWIRDIPPITRTWAFACVIVGIAIVSGALDLRMAGLINACPGGCTAVRIHRPRTTLFLLENRVQRWPVLEDLYEFHVLWQL